MESKLQLQYHNGAKNGRTEEAARGNGEGQFAKSAASRRKLRIIRKIFSNVASTARKGRMKLFLVEREGFPAIRDGYNSIEKITSHG